MPEKFPTVTVVLAVLLTILVVSQLAVTVAWGSLPETRAQIFSASETLAPSTVIATSSAIVILFTISLIGVVRRMHWGSVLVGFAALFDLVVNLFLSPDALYVTGNVVLFIVLLVLVFFNYRKLENH